MRDASGIFGEGAHEEESAASVEVIMYCGEACEVLLADGQRDAELAPEVGQPLQVEIGDRILEPVEVELLQHLAHGQCLGHGVCAHRVDHQVDMREFVS